MSTLSVKSAFVIKKKTFEWGGGGFVCPKLGLVIGKPWKHTCMMLECPKSPTSAYSSILYFLLRLMNATNINLTLLRTEHLKECFHSFFLWAFRAHWNIFKNPNIIFDSSYRNTYLDQDLQLNVGMVNTKYIALVVYDPLEWTTTSDDV